MQILHESEVTKDQIDHLGHMNVRFYAERAQKANRALMSSFGLGSEALKGQPVRLVQTDSYTRYQREQFQGSMLAAKGGVLKAASDGITMYFEVVNDAKAQVAATFIITTSMVDRATRAPLPLPEEAIDAAMTALVELPEHGRPRTIDLAPPRLDLGYADLAARLSEDTSDPMSRRMERTIEAAECDSYGFLKETRDLMFGGFRMPRIEPGAKTTAFGPMTFSSDDGRRFGWASMETRNVRISQPRAGDTICSIGAEIGLHAKIRHSRRWMFNVTSGALVSLNDNVNIALDLDARRSIEIPPEFRSKLELRHVPEFA
jgi:acyl-CoA thioesterase FadM